LIIFLNLIFYSIITYFCEHCFLLISLWRIVREKTIGETLKSMFENPEFYWRRPGNQNQKYFIQMQM